MTFFRKRRVIRAFVWLVATTTVSSFSVPLVKAADESGTHALRQIALKIHAPGNEGLVEAFQFAKATQSRNASQFLKAFIQYLRENPPTEKVTLVDLSSSDASISRSLFSEFTTFSAEAAILPELKAASTLAGPPGQTSLSVGLSSTTQKSAHRLSAGRHVLDHRDVLPRLHALLTSIQPLGP